MRSPRQNPAAFSVDKHRQAQSKEQPLRYVAAFRAYAWDDGIAELARRFFQSVPSARQVVLVDETLGPVEVPGYEKISHTAETACPDLPNYPRGRSLWYNVDYGIYVLHRTFPEFDYFLLSESDLAVNVPTLESMMRHVVRNRIDFVAHRVQHSPIWWFWHKHGLSLSPKPWQALLFFMVLSRRATECLLASRRDLARRFAAGDAPLWPFCEAFVPTALKSAGGMRFAEVSKFAETGNLNFRPWLSIHDPRAAQQGSLVHSVLGSKRLVAALLSTHPVQDFFKEGSTLRQGLLSEASFTNIVAPLRYVLAKNREFLGIERLKQEAVEKGWPLDTTVDLSLCTAAISSSVTRYSWSQDAEVDASGANGDVLAGDYGFHTLKEFHPWWMVDLFAIREIEEVTIVNRRSYADRFRTFSIETSSDGKAWFTRFEQTEPCNVSWDPKSPWRVRFAESFPARYLRIVLLGLGPLHLRHVQVLGKDPYLQSASRSLVDISKSLLEWPSGPLTDLAFRRPALSSSAGLFSLHPDPELDARGANGEALHYDFGFHTLKELNPWWMVDLLEARLIEEVAIVNRRLCQQRFRTFLIEASIDGEEWSLRFTQAEAIDVSSDPESPLRIQFDPPFWARYVRIILMGFETLHLRRIQVFGRIPFRRHQSQSMAEPGMHERLWPTGPLTDLAFLKPAKSSSVSRYSVHPDPERDAIRANHEDLAYDYAFHTLEELNPWWMVDLLEECIVEGVAIVNRRDQRQRFRTFLIETSSEGETWVTRFEQASPCDVSSDAASPWQLRFVEPFRARYFRIVLLGLQPLHLRRVQVFGRVPFRRYALMPK